MKAWLSLAACALVCLLAVGCPAPAAPPSPSSSKDLTSFRFASLHSAGAITGSSVAVLLITGTTVNNLVATFTTTGVSVKVGSTEQVSGTTANDFGGAVTYIVTAADGSTKSYTVTVAAAALLAARRYLASPSVAGADLTAVANQLTFTTGTNPFTDNSPVVFTNGAAPVNVTNGTIYSATGSTTTILGIDNLADSSPVAIGSGTTCTVYLVDWTPLHVGTISLAADEVIHLSSSGLSVGDTVYLAASPGNATLASGAYLVATIPDAASFTLVGAAVTAGDSFNYIAKVNDTLGATAF